jgi:hypothetical protein
MSKNKYESEAFIIKSLKALPLSQDSFDGAPHTKREETFENMTYVITFLKTKSNNWIFGSKNSNWIYESRATRSSKALYVDEKYIDIGM